jgi:hypothetical protein
VVDQRHLWWCFQWTLKNGDVVACILISVEIVLASELTDVLEVDCDS